jgi:prepilin-type N-terminal cleavage/methylation domain-containing protein
MINKNRVKGFTLMELLIAIAVIGILAAIAVPSYLGYSSRSAYSGVVSMADRYKISVADCIEYNSGTATNCNGGSNGIPVNISAPGVGVVNSVTVAAGVITVTPNNQNGISSLSTYVATPTYSTNSVTWTISGGVCGKGYISDC